MNDKKYINDLDKDVAICISILNNMRLKHKSSFKTLKSFYDYVEFIVESIKNEEKLGEYVFKTIKKV